MARAAVSSSVRIAGQASQLCSRSASSYLPTLTLTLGLWCLVWGAGGGAFNLSGADAEAEAFAARMRSQLQRKRKLAQAAAADKQQQQEEPEDFEDLAERQKKAELEKKIQEKVGGSVTTTPFCPMPVHICSACVWSCDWSCCMCVCEGVVWLTCAYVVCNIRRRSTRSSRARSRRSAARPRPSRRAPRPSSDRWAAAPAAAKRKGLSVGCLSLLVVCLRACRPSKGRERC